MAGSAATAPSKSKDILGMSDEDFLNLNSPADAGGDVEEKEETQQTKDAAEAAAEGGTPGASEARGQDDGSAQGSDADEADPDASAEQASADHTSPDTSDPEPEGDKQEEVKDPPKEETKADAKTDAKADPKDGEKTESKADTKVEEKTESVDYESFYKQVMAPFKANGRQIELKSPEEVIRLMQMGAGFGRKIQDIQPHLKVLRMLEKHDLLDEGKLSFLIDINAKNPDAIKKIIKDAGIDPLDLNNEDNVGYKPTNHAVSDKEMAFQDALTDVQGHATGQETLRLINQTWDQESKAALWDQPDLLRIIQSQRDNGIYDTIVTEIERQRLLGQIPMSTPFLQAYKTAGDYLQANNGFANLQGQENPIQTQQEQAPASTPQTQVIATRPAAPKAQVQNGEKAAAASPTKSSPSRGKGRVVNPLEMADEDFIKQFEGRL